MAKFIFTPTLFQFDFIYSKARHPAFVAGWGCGKSLCAISRSRLYSKGIPNSLGIIFRKTFRSLQDSTIKDFKTYTGLEPDGNRNLTDANGSVTMFRHIDELESINQQNLNLNWFYIEQAEELENSNPFFMLFGRLRRNVTPSSEFLKLGLQPRSGWVIGNAGDNWMRPVFKDGGLESTAQKIPDFTGKFSELFEATTWDNKKNLEPDFLASLKILEEQNPVMYRQFVLNDWDIAIRNAVFPETLIKHMFARQGQLSAFSSICGVAVDPAGEGDDFNVIKALRGGETIDTFRKTLMRPVEKAYTALEMCKRVNGYFIIVDCDGLGIETYSELSAMTQDQLQGIQIIKFHGSIPSAKKLCDRAMYQNLRCEAAFEAQRRAYSGEAAIAPGDKILQEELKADEYFTNTRGFLQLVDKKDIKAKLGRSPGDADCYKMWHWAASQNIENNVTIESLPGIPMHHNRMQTHTVCT